MTKANHLRALALMLSAALAVSFLVLVIAGGRAYASFPDLNGSIAFVSDRESTAQVKNDDIYVMKEDGSETQRLTTDLAAEQFPAVSPDGKKIAFVRGTGNNGDIWVMDIERGQEIPLTRNSASDSTPAWSPGSDKIAFTTNRDDVTNNDVYVMDAKDDDGDGQGDNSTRLTSDALFDGQPVFSPNGDKIAFLSTRDSPRDSTGKVVTTNNDIYVMDANGSNVTRLTTDASSDTQPEFSPQGDKLAFTSTRPTADENGKVTTDFDIWVMDVNGSNPSNLTNANVVNTDKGPLPLHDRYAAWSPDGKKIAFFSTTSTFFSDGEIYVMNADGSDLSNKTKNQVGDIQPDWGPDSTPPTTTAEATTSDKVSYTSDTLTNKEVTLKLSAEDNAIGSGVKEIRYSATSDPNVGGQDIPETVYDNNNPPVINTDGTTTVSYFATDKAGNQESPAKTFTIKLDKTGPSVVTENGTTPKDGDTNISRSIKEITATFSEPLDPKTVTPTTVQLFSGNSKTPLKAQVSLSPDGVVTFTPAQKLDAKTKYTAKLKGGPYGVKDLAGNNLAEDYVWYFTTGSQ